MTEETLSFHESLLQVMVREFLNSLTQSLALFTVSQYMDINLDHQYLYHIKKYCAIDLSLQH